MCACLCSCVVPSKLCALLPALTVMYTHANTNTRTRAHAQTTSYTHHHTHSYRPCTRTHIQPQTSFTPWNLAATHLGSFAYSLIAQLNIALAQNSRCVLCEAAHLWTYSQTCMKWPAHDCVYECLPRLEKRKLPYEWAN